MTRDCFEQAWFLFSTTRLAKTCSSSSSVAPTLLEMILLFSFQPPSSQRVLLPSLAFSAWLPQPPRSLQRVLLLLLASSAWLPQPSRSSQRVLLPLLYSSAVLQAPSSSAVLVALFSCLLPRSARMRIRNQNVSIPKQQHPPSETMRFVSQLTYIFERLDRVLS
jgi:hypothetical protein